MSPPSRARGAATWAQIGALVPTMINMLINHPDFERYDLTSLETCVYGGSPMPEALMKLAMQKLPQLHFYQVFGMTETGGFATLLRWRDHLSIGPQAQRLRSAGQAVLGNEVLVVRPDGTPAPTGELGEIIVRSNMLMLGYLNNLNPRGTRTRTPRRSPGLCTIA